VPVDAIGRSFGTSNVANAANSVISQQDFIRLFLAQLQFQDPLEPVDNREFLAQLAQFSNLEQTRKNGENTENLLAVTASTQALSLLGKTVDLSSGSGAVSGVVIGLKYAADGTTLTVRTGTGQVLNAVRLSQVSSVIQP
jgi:flagellar basal-body rod modification protein FlgD